MTEYRIEMVRAQGISEAERWRRICAAYDRILAFDLEDETADDVADPGRETTPPAAHRAPDPIGKGALEAF
jgi:hypothetical protein